MNFRNGLAGLAMLAAFVATTLLASADQSVTLYDGTILYARLNQQLDSGKANVGDTFTMTVVPPYPSGNPAFQGATLSGVITKVQRAGQGRNPEMDLQPQYVKMWDGTIASIYGNVTGIAAQKSTDQTAAKTVGAAIVGMLVGNAIGKTVFHSSAGGAMGLIGGAMIGANNKSNFQIPQGAGATVQLSQTVTIRKQTRPPDQQQP